MSSGPSKPGLGRRLSQEFSDNFPQTCFAGAAQAPLKALAKLYAVENNIPSAAQFSTCFNAAVAALLEDESSPALSDAGRKEILSQPTLNILFHGLFSALKEFSKRPVKDSKLTNDLNRLQFPASFNTAFLSSLESHKVALHSHALAALASAPLSLPHIVDLDWRLDVAVSSTQLQRVFKPSIFFRLTLSDFSIVDFECSSEKFLDFRYQIAKAWKKTQEIINHPTINRDIE